MTMLVWTGKTVLNSRPHDSWPDQNLPYKEKACTGAVCSLAIAIQYESTGGAQLVTPEADVAAWLHDLSELI